jgi:hypothetical protein
MKSIKQIKFKSSIPLIGNSPFKERKEKLLKEGRMQLIAMYLLRECIETH